MVKWAEKDIFRLLDLYEENECLWNPAHIHYKNKARRQNALLNMVEILDIPDLDCDELKKKLKSIRSTYNQEWNKISISRQSGLGSQTKLVWYSRANSFLRKVHYTKKSILNSAGEFQGIECVPVIVDDSVEHLCSDDLDIPTVGANQCLTSVDVSEMAVEERSYEMAQKRTKKEMGNVASALGDIKHRSAKEDRSGTFGDHVAACLRDLPLRRQIALERKIMQIIDDDILENMGDDGN